MRIIVVEAPEEDILLAECLFSDLLMTVLILPKDPTKECDPIYIPYKALREALELFNAKQ